MILLFTGSYFLKSKLIITFLSLNKSFQSFLAIHQFFVSSKYSHQIKVNYLTMVLHIITKLLNLNNKRTQSNHPQKHEDAWHERPSRSASTNGNYPLFHLIYPALRNTLSVLKRTCGLSHQQSVK